MASMICPSCQNINQEGRTVCWYCGTPLSAAPAAPTANELAPEAADTKPLRKQTRDLLLQRMRQNGNAWGNARIMCQNCGVWQDYNRFTCMRCGSNLSRNPWVCSVCGKQNKREAHFCIFCHEPTGPIPAAETAPEPDAQVPERDTLEPQKFDFQTGDPLFAPVLVQRPGWFRCPSCSADLHMGENKRPEQILKACPSCGAKFAIKEWVCPRCLQLNPVAAEECCFCGTKSSPAGRHAARAAYDKMLVQAEKEAGTGSTVSSGSSSTKNRKPSTLPATGGSTFVGILILLLGLLSLLLLIGMLSCDGFWEYKKMEGCAIYIIINFIAVAILGNIPVCYKKDGNKRVYHEGAKLTVSIGTILAGVAFLIALIRLFSSGGFHLHFML